MRHSHGRAVILIAISALLLLVWTFPVLWGVVTSLKTERDVLAYPPTMIFEPTWGNYLDALIGRDSIVPNLWSSFIIATTTTALTILFAVPAAYAFARLRLRAKKTLGFYTLATQMVPPVGLVIPYFLILNHIGWLDTYQGMIIVYLTFSLPFAIWLMVSYMEDIPFEMEEAALLDRANRFQTLWYIILPQVRGGIAVTVIFIFLNAWNEFLFAVQLSGNEVRPVTVAMYNFISVEQTLWAKLSAAAMIAMLPVIILGLAGQKHIVKGLTVGAIKGGARR
jgi:ABC-type glycerol-3-phosphate transport system permease component